MVPSNDYLVLALSCRFPVVFLPAGMVSDDDAYYNWLAGLLAADAGLPFGPALPYGVEVSVRDLDNGDSAVFVLNWGGGNVTAAVPAAAGGIDVLTGTRIDSQGSVALGPYGVAVIAV
jgi:hypothetical protein